MENILQKLVEPKRQSAQAWKSQLRKLGGTRQIKVKIFLPSKEILKQTISAGTTNMYSPEGVVEVLDYFIDKIDKAYPSWEFRLVEVGAGQFNFIYDGLRKPTDQEEYDNRLHLSQHPPIEEANA